MQRHKQKKGFLSKGCANGDLSKRGFTSTYDYLLFLLCAACQEALVSNTIGFVALEMPGE